MMRHRDLQHDAVQENSSSDPEQSGLFIGSFCGGDGDCECDTDDNVNYQWEPQWFWYGYIECGSECRHGELVCGIDRRQCANNGNELYYAVAECNDDVLCGCYE
jgi:hypothetical protein